MRRVLTAAAGLMLAIPGTAMAAVEPGSSPFGVAALPDADLARVTGTGDPRWRTFYRLTDDIATDVQRQTASIGAIVRDMWLIDVASPLIAANVRAASPR